MQSTKYCRHCDTTKPIEAFYEFTDCRGKKRRQAKCRVCQAAITKAWREKNKELQKEYRRRFCAKNPDKVAEYEKKHQEKRNIERAIFRAETCLTHALNGTADIAKAIAFKKQFFLQKRTELRTVV